MCYTWSHGALNKLYVCDLFGWCSEDDMSWLLCCIVLAYLWNKFEKYYQWLCYLHFIICHIYKSKDAVDNNFRWVELQSVWHAIVTVFHLFLSIDKLPQKNRRLHLKFKSSIIAIETRNKHCKRYNEPKGWLPAPN